MLQYFLVRKDMVRSMVIYWEDSVAQETAVELLGLVVLSWVVGLDYRMGNPYKAMLGERVSVDWVSVRKIVVSMEVLL